MAATVNLEADQGATFVKKFIWRVNNATPEEVDLTGYTARMHLREAIDSTETVLELTTENGRVTLGGTDGTIDLLIDATDTTGVTAATYRYDLELVSSGGVVTRLIEGKFKFTPEVTR